MKRRCSGVSRNETLMTDNEPTAEDLTRRLVWVEWVAVRVGGKR